MEAPELKELGAFLETSKMTPSIIQFRNYRLILTICFIDGVILETLRTVPDSWRSIASNVKMDLKSVRPYR